MGKFSKIKKYNLDSLSIDEKIKFLDKEMEKTGLNEVAANSTSGVYSSNETQPNPAHTNFAASSFNGLPLGFSGHDGTDMGGAYTGKLIASEHGLSSPSHDYLLSLEGVAVSPPHPVSGKRVYASTRTGMVSFSPTQPGKIQGNSDVPTGSVMWIWNPNANNSDGTTGQWYPLEFDVILGKWGFWDSNFLGFGFLNTNLDQLEFTSGDNTGTTLNTLVTNNGLNVQNMGQPDTTVLVTKSLESADNLPIMIDGLSGPGYEYIKSKALASADPNLAFFGNKGKGKVTKKLFKGPIANTLNLLSNQIINGQDFNGQLQKQFDRLTGGSISPEKYNKLYPLLTNPSIKETEFNKILDDANKSSIDDDLDSFASAGYEPETGTVPNDEAGEGPKPSKASGKGAKVGEWMSRTDFMALYPNSSMTEYLDALPYGGTNFMKPDPNFPGARIVDTDAYEKYFMTGNTSGLSDSKPKHKETSEVEYTPQELKKGFSVNQTLNYLKTKFKSPLGPATDIMADIVANTFGQRGSKAVLDDYMRNFIPDLFSGKNVAGKTSGNPRNVGNMYSNKALNDFEKVFAQYQSEQEQLGNPNTPDNLKRLLKDPTTNWKSEFHATSAANSEIGNTYGQFGSDVDGVDDFVDNGDGTVSLIKRYDFDDMADLAGSDPASTLGAYTYGIISGIPGLLGKGEGGKTPSSYLGITFDKKTGKVIKNYKKGIAESLDESVKLGHFNPEALTVDIEKLRKGVLPEFPKDAPPKMIDGYSEKSKLAPKKAEKEPFIKITKKDLAKNHKLKDSEIKEFMDTFKMINDFIKKHPEELIHAQQRYPVGDKRLAELNWKMDQMLEAGQEYLDTQFPENQRLVDRIKKATKKTMELTNPEAYKGLKKPDMELMSLDNYMKEKRVVSRHFKKKRQSRSMFRVDMEKVKEKNRKVAEQKVAEWQEKRRIELLNSNEFDELKSDWKKELGEGMTTQMLTGILPSAGNRDLDMLQLGASGADLSYTTNGDVTDGVFTALTNTDTIDNVNDPHGIGTRIRSPIHPDGDASLDFTPQDPIHTSASPPQPSAVPGDTGGMRGVDIAGNYNVMAPQTYVNAYGATNENIPLNHFNDEYLRDRVGTYLTWGTGFGAIAGFPRFAALKAVDTSEMDTFSINWFMFGTINIDGNDESPTYQKKVVSNPSRFTEPGDGVVLFYWAGDKEGAQSYAPDMNVHGGKHDGWRPINVKPDGTTDNSYSAYLIPHRPDGALYNSGGRQKHNGGYPAQVLLNNKITLPPWCRDKNTRFLLHQGKNKIGASRANFGITSVRFQRRSTMRVRSLMKPLSDVETSPFVRVGPTKKNEGGKERKKKVQDIIRSGLKYTGKKFSKDFPVRTDLE